MDEGLMHRIAAMRADEEAARATIAKALGAGLAGAVTLTAMHETVKRFASNPPRMDRLGERALAAALRGFDVDPPSGRTLRTLALGGDLLANGLFYGLLLTNRPFRPWTRQIVGGAVAGLGALLVPPRIGLGSPPHSRHRSNQALTVALYVAGGLAAAAVFRLLAPRPDF